MNYKTASQEAKNSVYEPLIQQQDRNIYTIEEVADEDDRIQPKCFAFKTEIKATIKYIIKECPKIKF